MHIAYAILFFFLNLCNFAFIKTIFRSNFNDTHTQTHTCTDLSLPSSSITHLLAAMQCANHPSRHASRYSSGNYQEHHCSFVGPMFMHEECIIKCTHPACRPQVLHKLLISSSKAETELRGTTYLLGGKHLCTIKSSKHQQVLAHAFH